MATRTDRAGLPARPRLLVPVIVVVAVLLVLGGLAVSFYTDLLWFQETGYTEVFSTVLLTRLGLFVGFGILMAVIIGANLVVAYKVRPPFRPMSLEQQNLERYRVAVEPYLTPVLIGTSAVFGVFAGLSAAGRWQTWLLWRNSVDFGVTDPQFGRDISYYVMSYPFQRFVLGFLITGVVLAVLAAAATHYLFGAVRLQTVGEKVSPAARAHLSVLVGLVVLLKAVAYYLDRFGLVFSTRGRTPGASFTDVNAVLPAKNILIFIAVICAILFFANIVVRNILLPAGALGLLVLSAVVLGGIFPAYTQQFRVTPNELQRETPFIERNIGATRAAYGIDDVETEVYTATQNADPEQLQAEVGSVEDVRLLDPARLGQTFEQLQRLTFYFGVGNQLDIDRYEVDGELQDFIVAAREVDINNLAGAQRSWINERLAYTHGNGLIAAPANEVDSEGRPVFVSGDDAPFDLDQPRIYYGEQSPSYSVVNTNQPEIDGPQGLADGDEPVEGADETFTYDGDGGVQISNPVRKLAYALRFREPNLLLSDAIRDDSRLMYIREPRERVQKVAPFLELDADPYPAVVDGRILWIVDGYTTSDAYPYATRTNFGDATVDSQSGRIQRDEVNYIRNSVKATVDAYTGDVTLYKFGEPDPIIEAWDAAFGGDVLRDESEISDELRAHLRYPEDLFKVQRQLLTEYHVTTPAELFSRENAWEVPPDPADAINRQTAAAPAPAPGAAAAPLTLDTAGVADQPPFYSLLALPDRERSFSLNTSFTGLNRPNLAAFASVSSDPEDYGQIRILELPRTLGNNAPDGPGQVANRFVSNTAVADVLFPFRQNRAEVTFGNLLTLPAGGGLLYVQPVFVRAQGGESFPTLQRVLVNYGDDVAAGTSLAESLAELFGTAAPPAVDPLDPPDQPDPPVDPPTTPDAPPADLGAAVDAAVQAFEDGQAALAAGDFAGYGLAQDRLEAALAQIAALEAAAP